MKLKSFGCSFVYGSDLPDCQHREGADHPPPSAMTWPSLLAKMLRYDHECYAWPGTGNLRILERVLSQVNDPDPSIYLINWTWIDRMDYVDDDVHPWQAWAWQSVMPGDQGHFGKLYFKNYHAQIKDQVNSLILIHQAISELQRRSLPFVMTYMDELIIEKFYPSNHGLAQMRDHVMQYLVSFQGQNFLQWSESLGYEISDKAHPLQQAHQSAAEYMLPVVRNAITSQRNSTCLQNVS